MNENEQQHNRSGKKIHECIENILQPKKEKIECEQQKKKKNPKVLIRTDAELYDFRFYYYYSSFVFVCKAFWNL